jgi:molybdopterin synthase catalytic subunit
MSGSAESSAAGAVRFATVSSEPIGVEQCIEAVSRDHAGAVVSFAGVVRDHDEGKGVTALSYTGHPSAQDAIEEAAGRIAAAHPETVVAVAHRVGDLVVGDIALACAVSSAHRQEAFAACSELVDLVKQTVPIWKEQLFDDGSSEWVAALG